MAVRRCRRSGALVEGVSALRAGFVRFARALIPALKD
jgi:hypothetical protein